MTTHGFIFARGGSKGLPGKNIKLLAGRPLIEYAIDVAKQVAALDTVFVSTDDKIIAGVAAKAGATIIDRPADLASDNAAEWYAWRHAIEWVRERHGHFEGFVSLPTTSPLRCVADVEAAMKKQAECGSDICIGITEAGHSPYFNMVKKKQQWFC
jgi:N-acylneuraminate cytidylyltransferase